MLKSELRQLYKEKRKEIKKEDKSVYDLSIFSALQAMDWNHFSYIHVFLPIEHLNEPSLQIFIEWIWDNLPHIKTVTSTLDAKNHNLSHHIYDRNSKVQLNTWKIPEVIGGKAVSEVEIDAVLIPMLVCDRSGNRVGYGKGFYDRFLSKCRKDIKKIGISYFEPIEKIKDVNKFDIPINMCISPHGIYDFSI